MSEDIQNPKVFISYSWSSVPHQKFVIGLAEKLTTDGVIVVIDKWDLKEGQDKYAFMEQMVTDKTVNKVLIISDKKYAEKADTKSGGVGTESQIISSEIYTKVKQTKFIPIVTEFDENGREYLPTFLKNRIYINFGEESIDYDEYEKLLRNIYNKPVFKKPSLGTIPAHLLQDNQITVNTLHKYSRLKDAIESEKPVAKLLCLEYFEELFESLQSFRLPEADAYKEPDDQVVDSIKAMKEYSDQLFEVFKLLITSTNDFAYYEMIFTFLEKSLTLNYSSDGTTTYNEWWYENFQFFNMETFLYLNALLLKYGKIDEIKYFTEEKYYIQSGYGKGGYPFAVFNAYLRSLDEYRKSRLKLNRMSITADLLKERCDKKYITFDDIMQTDFILTLKSTFNNTDVYSRWFPYTLAYKGWHSQTPFSIFLKAESKRHFEIVSKLFDVKDKSELLIKFNEASNIFNFKNWRFSYQSIQFEQFLNLDKLYTG